ncbi:MAG: hypothetical protein NT028_06170 [candidate division Zixibacteria bacterium]|nr:hypothetical protein [candidate division Zixibacteria bacterium]
MKRIGIAILLLACMFLMQGKPFAQSLIVENQPATGWVTDAPADPNDGGSGTETPE